MKTINDYAELVKEKHALNKTIAPVETDLTDASREYHIGEQFIINGGLFKAKTEIAQHDALVLNTNYEPADNLTEQIKNAGGGTGTDPRLDVFENNIAPVETDETDASRAYQVGEQLILDNILYDVIVPISEHDVITTTGSGANIEPADPLSSQVQTLTNQVKGNWSEGGVNLFNPSTYAAYKQADGSYRGTAAEINSITVSIPQSLVGKQLTFWTYFDLTKETSPSGVRTYAEINGTKITGNGIYPDQEGISSVTFTPQSTNDVIGITYNSGGANYFSFKDIQLEVGSSATTYVPYAMTNMELTEKIHAIKTANYISKSADSSKTWATLINEAVTALNSLLATLGSGEYLTIQRVLINGDHVNIPNDYMMNTNTFNRYGSELMVKADRLQAAEVHLASSGSYFHRTDIISSGGTLTYNYTDTGAQVPTSGAVRIDYVIFN